MKFALVPRDVGAKTIPVSMKCEITLEQSCRALVTAKNPQWCKICKRFNSMTPCSIATRGKKGWFKAFGGKTKQGARGPWKSQS